MRVLSWAAFKNFVDSRQISIQWIEDENFYFLVAFDNYFSVECSLSKRNKNEELDDFETNYKAAGNQSPQNVVTTQFELNNKDLKLAKCKGSIDSQTKQAIIYLLIPGEFNVDDGRWVAGGYATLDTFDPDDSVSVYVEDKDRLFCSALGLATDGSDDATIREMGVLPAPIGVAFPDYPIVKSYTDDEQSSENQGWYFDPLARGGTEEAVGYCDIEPIAGYGHVPAGLYLKMIVTRTTLTTGVARISVWWGKKE